jgi:hypothetical protein
VLPAADDKAQTHKTVAHLSVGVVDLGVEVPPQVLGDGLHERSVRSGAAGAEGDEAPAIRSHDRHGLTDDRLTVVGRPTVRRPGDNEVHGLDPRAAS